MESGSKTKAKKQSKVPVTDDGQIFDVRKSENDCMLIEEEGNANTFDPIPFATDRWNARIYGEHIQIRIVSQSDDSLELDFDLINVEAPLANALRRILIAEVPTMAIEKVFLYQNTSCIQDEILCHRLGLLPIYSDPREFAFPAHIANSQQINTDYLDEEPTGEPKRNLIFELQAICQSQEKTKKKRMPTGKLIGTSDTETGSSSCMKEPGDSGNWVLYSSALKWIPIGEQKQQLARNNPRMVHGDIVLAKLRPGQEIEARCHCVKGIGRDHAKFSPVATATYRMLPQIKLNRDHFDEDQFLRLQSSFSKGVIGRNDTTGRVYVKNARADTSSRNIFRHEDLKDAVEMTKKKTHFIFSVESTGAMPAHELVKEACEIMKEKLDKLRRHISSDLALILS